jgi:hypothetical protein
VGAYRKLIGMTIISRFSISSSAARVTVACGSIRDIRVGVAFGVFNVVIVVSGMFSRDASVFVSSRVLHYPRALSSLAFEPI